MKDLRAVGAIAMFGVILFILSLIFMITTAEAGGEISLFAVIAPDSTLDWHSWTPSGAGDLNNDGYDDFVIGLPFGYQVGQFWPGMLRIYLGGAEFDTLPDVEVYHVRDDCPLGIGSTIEAVGDINGDGFDDLVLGAETECFLWTGDAYVYLGGAVLDTFPQISIIPYIPVGSYFGHSMASLRDINGDSYMDFIIGAPEFYPMSDEKGSVFIFYGGDPFDPEEQLFVEGDSLENCGTHISAGDFDGDGIRDILISFPEEEAQENPDTGFVRLYPGHDLNPERYVQFNNVDSITEIRGCLFLGDINDDGYDDIGIHRQFNGETIEETWIDIYFGSAVMDTTVDMIYQPLDPNQNLIPAGDLDGDGVDDLLYVRCADDSVNDVIEIFAGGAGFDLEPDYIDTTWLPHHYVFWVDAGPAGDLNNDGITEFFVNTDSVICIYNLEMNGVDDGSQAKTPGNLGIRSITPNPANSSVSIKFDVAEMGVAKIEVYDLLGRRLYSTEYVVRSPGQHSANFNLSDFPSGIYFVRLNLNELSDTRKMAVLK